jgi:hypothetical protein
MVLSNVSQYFLLYDAAVREGVIVEQPTFWCLEEYY